MSQKMNYGKFVVISGVALLAIMMVAHFAWFGPQLERKAAMIDLFGAAHAVQSVASLNDSLVADANASAIDLLRKFPDAKSLQKLLRLSSETGVDPDTGFNRDTMGNALALSNFVLTGENEPKFLALTENQKSMESRRNELIASVPMWPW